MCGREGGSGEVASNTRPQGCMVPPGRGLSPIHGARRGVGVGGGTTRRPRGLAMGVSHSSTTDGRRPLNVLEDVGRGLDAELGAMRCIAHLAQQRVLRAALVRLEIRPVDGVLRRRHLEETTREKGGGRKGRDAEREGVRRCQIRKMDHARDMCEARRPYQERAVVGPSYVSKQRHVGSASKLQTMQQKTQNGFGRRGRTLGE